VVQGRISRIHDIAQLRDEESIDDFVSVIIRALDAGIEASTPWSNPSPHSIAGFDQECKSIRAEVQRLRRRWQRTRRDDDYEAYRQVRNRKGRHIRKTLRNAHRQKVEDTSASPAGLWKLVKCAKNRHETSPTCTPTLVSTQGEHAHRPEDKARIYDNPSFLPHPKPISRTQRDTNTHLQSKSRTSPLDLARTRPRPNPPTRNPPHGSGRVLVSKPVGGF
jgi:hypothetical protein